MKTTLFTLLFALMISVATAQVMPTRTTASNEQTAAIWVWSIQGQATYQEDGFKMARPLHEGTLLTHQADIWVSDNGQVVLLYNGTSTALHKGAHSVSDLVQSPSGDLGSGFSSGIAPTPPPSGRVRGRDDGTGFGQGVAPSEPTSGSVSGRGDEGSGFGQGANPAPAGEGVGRRGDEGSGFGQGAAPAEPTSGSVGGRGDEGSGFGQNEGTPPGPATSDDEIVNRRTGDGMVPNPDREFLNWINRHREAGSGFGQGTPPPPPTSGGVSGRGDEGSGFGQGANPAPAGEGVGRRGDEGSGFGQGAAPAEPTSGSVGGRGDEGSGFSDGADPNPPPIGKLGGRGDDGSGFGQGAGPSEPTSGGVLGRRDGGSGFGDGVTPSPPTSGGLSGRRDKGTGHSAVTKVSFEGGYGGNVTLGPVDYIWTAPGPGQTCQFKIWNKKTPDKPVFQANTARSGMILDLRDLNLQVDGNYVSTISLGKGSASSDGTVNFTIVGPEIQMMAFQNAKSNLLYPVASPSHQSILNAMELEKVELLTAATVQYQRAYELNPRSELVNAMIYSFKKKQKLSE